MTQLRISQSERYNTKMHSPCLSVIRDMIQQKGVLSFAEFMMLALYHPQYGYYCRENFALGRWGDFITAPLLSPLFGACLAKPCQQTIEKLGGADILECGAGTGELAIAILQTLAAEKSLPTHYYIYEISQSLKEKQRKALSTHLPRHLFERCVWLDTLPPSFQGVILANEVLDALPVHCFAITEAGIKERCIGWEEDHLAWHLTQPLTPGLKEAVQTLKATYHLPTPYQSEINLGLADFIQPLARALQKGIMLFIDYGYEQNEYYHPLRQQGTLTCFYQHRHHDDPLALPGLQDITAHVDFTRVIESAEQCGCEVTEFTTQALFLLNCGLREMAIKKEASLNEREKFTLRQALKTLLLPTEMGERVKVLTLSKNL